MNTLITHAIAERRLLMFAYGGAVRVAEPHLYGLNTAGHEALSAWIRPGWSRADPEGGWRMYLADQLENLQMLPEAFDAPRADFNPSDAHFTQVFASVSAPPDETEPQG